MNGKDETVSVLKRLERLVAALVRSQLADRIEKLRAEPRHRALYDSLGDGVTQSELAKKVGVTQPTVSRTLQEWEAEGLVVKEGGEYRRLV